MTTIHDTAVVHTRAELAADVYVGPYAIIEEGVEIGEGSHVGPHCYIAKGTRMGRRNRFVAHASIGTAPQDLKNFDIESALVIGDDNTVREFVSINRGTPKEQSLTSIGDRNFLMTCSHVGHDCVLGNDIIITNGVLMGGHCHIADGVVLNGMVGINQFTSIGRGAYVGGHSRVIQDVPPFVKASGDPAEVRAINEIGMQRMGIAPADIAEVKHVYRTIFRRGSSVIEEAHNFINDASPLVRELAEFLLRKEAGRYGRYRESLRGH